MPARRRPPVVPRAWRPRRATPGVRAGALLLACVLVLVLLAGAIHAADPGDHAADGCSVCFAFAAGGGVVVPAPRVVVLHGELPAPPRCEAAPAARSFEPHRVAAPRGPPVPA